MNSTILASSPRPCGGTWASPCFRGTWYAEACGSLRSSTQRLSPANARRLSGQETVVRPNPETDRIHGAPLTNATGQASRRKLDFGTVGRESPHSRIAGCRERQRLETLRVGRIGSPAGPRAVLSSVTARIRRAADLPVGRRLAVDMSSRGRRESMFRACWRNGPVPSDGQKGIEDGRACVRDAGMEPDASENPPPGPENPANSPSASSPRIFHRLSTARRTRTGRQRHTKSAPGSRANHAAPNGPRVRSRTSRGASAIDSPGGVRRVFVGTAARWDLPDRRRGPFPGEPDPGLRKTQCPAMRDIEPPAGGPEGVEAERSDTFLRFSRRRRR